uniref:Uncharacterized protein n=1 Tax=Noccaea caerulescens TaxID=107243 RepID=A0A1J3JV85_NOCCA
MISMCMLNKISDLHLSYVFVIQMPLFENIDCISVGFQVSQKVGSCNHCASWLVLEWTSLKRARFKGLERRDAGFESKIDNRFFAFSNHPIDVFLCGDLVGV